MTAIRQPDTLRLLAAHQAATEFYRAHLLDTPTALDYLRSRGITPGHASDPPWLVGYAPPGWTLLRDHLRAAGFTDTELLAAGLITVARNTNHIDVFRDRLMFPIRSADGQVVAFTGRDLSGRDGTPKYRNTITTSIYHKSTTLYGLAEQLTTNTGPAAVLLVEGPADVLALAPPGTRRPDQQAADGFLAVAPCGTALTREQVTLLASTVPAGTPLVLAFDPDPAGHMALDKAYQLLGDWAGPLEAIALPEGADPAELAAQQGPARARLLLHQARSPVHDAVLGHRLAPHLHRLDQRARELTSLGRDPSWELHLRGIDVVRAVAPLLVDAARTDAQHAAALTLQLARRLHLDPLHTLEIIYPPQDIEPTPDVLGPDPPEAASIPLGTHGWPDPTTIGHAYARTPPDGPGATWVQHDPRTGHTAWVLAEPVTPEHPADQHAAHLAAQIAGRAAILVGAQTAIQIARTALNTAFAEPGTVQGNATIAVVCSFDGAAPQPGSRPFSIAWAGDVRAYGAGLLPDAHTAADRASDRPWFAALTTAHIAPTHRFTPATSPAGAGRTRAGSVPAVRVLTSSVRGGPIEVNQIDLPLTGILLTGHRAARLHPNRLRTALDPYRPQRTITNLTRILGPHTAALAITPRPWQVRELTAAQLARQDHAATTTTGTAPARPATRTRYRPLPAPAPGPAAHR